MLQVPHIGNNMRRPEAANLEDWRTERSGCEAILTFHSWDRLLFMFFCESGY